MALGLEGRRELPVLKPYCLDFSSGSSAFVRECHFVLQVRLSSVGSVVQQSAES